jgi:hypothetical protein
MSASELRSAAAKPCQVLNVAEDRHLDEHSYPQDSKHDGPLVLARTPPPGSGRRVKWSDYDDGCHGLFLNPHVILFPQDGFNLAFRLVRFDD